MTTEAERFCDFADLRVLPLEHFAGCLDPQLDDEGLRTHAESFGKLPVKLARGEVDRVREFLD